MYLTYKDALRMLAIFITFAELFMMTYLAEQAGFIPISSNTDIHANSKFTLHVSANGETIYTAAENVSQGVRKVIMNQVYPSPDAAVEAIEPVSGQVAYAHAVNVCWHHTYGKSSHQTGGGDHYTWWRRDYNGFRFTTTQHRILTQSGYQPTETYKYRVDKRYCN